MTVTYVRFVKATLEMFLIATFWIALYTGFPHWFLAVVFIALVGTALLTLWLNYDAES